MPTTGRVWPPGINQDILVDAYDEGLADNRIEQQMEQGPYKSRRRGTARFYDFQIAVRMSEEELETFRTFYEVTLLDGTLNFDWVHPRNKLPAFVQFKKPAPKPRAISGEVFDVQMMIQVQLI